MANDNKDDIIIAMLEEIKSLTKNSKSAQIDLTRIDNLAEKMERNVSTTSELTEQLSETIRQAWQPVINERRFIIDIVSKKLFFFSLV